MKLLRDDADILVPDGCDMPEALSRTTHLCVGAHQDDQEFMAYHGISECLGRSDRWFTGVCVTNGSGSVRVGCYADFTDEEMMAVRKEEQRKAAVIGEYACEIQLGYPSSVVKDSSDKDIETDVLEILKAARPEVVYVHNPADKHDTHVATMLRCLAALRALPAEDRPKKVYGCEIWRSLDWLDDDDKQALPVDEHEEIASELSGVFHSQIEGGKRYDIAIIGRRKANATFFESHKADAASALSWAIDLTPVMNDESLDIAKYTAIFIDRFRQDVISRVSKFSS